MLLSIILMLVVLLAGCSSSNIPSGAITETLNDEKAKINVFVSIIPQKYFVERIGGEKVNVSVMIPPGADPEHYEFTAQELTKLSNADLYIKIGHLPVEKIWMDRIKSTNKNMMVIDSSESIKIREHDPHIWLSPRLVKIQAKNICKALVELDKDNTKYYENNLEHFLNELDELDTYIQQELKDIQKRMFIVYHPAWGYFANDYNLEEIGIEDHGKEPSAKEMREIIDKAKANHLKVVFDSPQHSSRSSKAIADELGGEVRMLDPLPTDFIIDMKKTVSILKNALTDCNNCNH